MAGLGGPREGVTSPLLDQCYRVIDALAEAKESTESHLYARLTDLTNLDLRLVCYDLTSTYFETEGAMAESFPSRRYGYSRDNRQDRPQVVIGLLVTGNGIPMAHHVFPGNTKDSSTLSSVMAEAQRRFGVGGIALVADRGLISEKNLSEVQSAGFDHVLATRLHRDHDVTAVLEEAVRADKWVPVHGTNSKACEIFYDKRCFVVVASHEQKRRDDARRGQLLARTKDKVIALNRRVSEVELTDPAKIGAAADRILRDSGVARCFKVLVRQGFFSWDYDEEALRQEEELLVGRYVLTTSLHHTQASTADVVRHYRTLVQVERRFRVMKDFLAVRPVDHRTGDRVRGHIALCIIAAVIEVVMGNDLEMAGVKDPDVPGQTMTPRRALVELGRIRRHHLELEGRHIDLIDRPSALQAKILAAFDVNTSTWSKAEVS